jgi:hypothetical protein
MFCPGCGTESNEALKFCKRCGANLSGVRDTLTRPAGRNFDPTKTWVAEMLMTSEEKERRRGTTPEEKRYKEIKGGVITSMAGLALMIFLRIFFEGVAQSEPQAAEILRRLWVVGIIPLLVGLGIVINGFFISRRIVEMKRRQQLPAMPAPLPLSSPQETIQPDAYVPAVPDFSVAEPSTQRMPDSAASPGRSEDN